MTIHFRRRSSVCLVGLVMAAAGVADVGAQAPQVLDRLTVPAAKLPTGCGLQPVEKSRSMILPDGKVVLTGNAGQPPRNPWMGTDNAVRTAARRAVEGAARAPRLPDAPPPSREERAAWTAKGLADIAEGYQATYTGEGKDVVEVAAVRYVDAPPATSPEPGQLILGTTVVRVSGTATSACYGAVWSHLDSLR